MAHDVSAERTQRHVPDKPAANKRVMKVDLFEMATKSVGTLQLVPVFPYSGRRRHRSVPDYRRGQS